MKRLSLGLRSRRTLTELELTLCSFALCFRRLWHSAVRWVMQRGCPEPRCVLAIGFLGSLTFYDVPLIAAAISLPAIEKKKSLCPAHFLLWYWHLCVCLACILYSELPST